MEQPLRPVCLMKPACQLCFIYYNMVKPLSQQALTYALAIHAWPLNMHKAGQCEQVLLPKFSL